MPITRFSSNEWARPREKPLELAKIRSAADLTVEARLSIHAAASNPEDAPQVGSVIKKRRKKMRKHKKKKLLKRSRHKKK